MGIHVFSRTETDDAIIGVHLHNLTVQPCAAALYIDVINLFIRILSILGRR